MILVANKVDLVHQRKVTEEDGKALAAELGVRSQIDLRSYVVLNLMVIHI